MIISTGKFIARGNFSGWKSYDGDRTLSGRHGIRSNVWFINKDKKKYR